MTLTDVPPGRNYLQLLKCKGSLSRKITLPDQEGKTENIKMVKALE